MKKMGHYRLIVGVLVGINSTVVVADGASWQTEGGVGLSSDYLFRGVSQSSGVVALSAGWTAHHQSGVYLGVWGSSIAFAQGLELDPRVGLRRSIGVVTYDVGVMYYGYPGGAEEKLPFTEVYGSLYAQGLTLGLARSNHYSGDTGKSLYTYVSYQHSLDDYALSATLGQSHFEGTQQSVADGYLDYQVAVSRPWNGFQFQLAYAGSNLSHQECAVFVGDSNDCSRRFVISAEKPF